MRGKVCFSVQRPLPQGITPACAGKSSGIVAFWGYHRDHPRVCGEKYSLRFLLSSPTGSPPRVRGKVGVYIDDKTVQRITPACAGKRCGKEYKKIIGGDHPRVCGEKRNVGRVVETRLGSPPRVRGKDGPVDLRVCHAGITPACAGKRPGCALSCKKLEDHPRVCGEKKTTQSGNSVCTGSPPRVRGKGLREQVIADSHGITPACAGKSRRPA